MGKKLTRILKKHLADKLELLRMENAQLKGQFEALT